MTFERPEPYILIAQREQIWYHLIHKLNYVLRILESEVIPLELSKEAREARNQYARNWRQNNKEKVKAYIRKYRAENPEKLKEWAAKHWERAAQKAQG
jgi:hypothetical protein